MSSETVLGIDFGSFYWTAFVYSNGQRSIVSDEHGNRSLNASICFRDNEVIVGSSASQLASSFPENVINHPLHYLDGRSCSPDCNASIKTTLENGYPVFHLPFAKKTERVTLERVFVECFKKLYALSALPLHSKPTLTVVSVPSDLSASSQSFLLSCLHHAKLPNPSLLPSHLAVLLARELVAPPADGLRLVLDVPANSAILSLVSVSRGFYTTLWSHRLATAVGSALDARFLAFATQEAVRKLGPEVAQSAKAVRKLRRAVAECKERLSSTMTSAVAIESLFDGADFMLSVSRSRLAMLAFDALGQLCSEIQSVLRARRCRLDDCAQIFVVGGCSAMPAVQEALRTAAALRGPEMVFFPRVLEVAAEGASVQAQYREEFRLKKSLPVLQQLAGSLVIRAGKWEMMIAEQGVPFPCKCETSGVVECEEATKEMMIEFRREAKGHENKDDNTENVNETKTQLVGTLTFENDLCGKSVAATVSREHLGAIRVVLSILEGEKEVEKKKFTIGEKD